MPGPTAPQAATASRPASPKASNSGRGCGYAQASQDACLDRLDERNLFELTSPDFPGKRLVACRNPALAHIFLCLLADYVEWHMLQAWRPLWFALKAITGWPEPCRLPSTYLRESPAANHAHVRGTSG